MLRLSRPRDWPPSRRALAFFAVACAVCSALTTAAFWWGGVLGSFVAMLSTPILAVGALFVVVLGLVDGWRAKQDMGRALMTGTIPVLGVCFSPVLCVVVFFAIQAALLWGTLLTKEPAYAHVIYLAARNRLPPPGKSATQFASDGTEFEAERNAPHRVAFPLPGGFLNDWQGILYDPNGIGLRVHAVQPNGEPGDLLDNWWTIGDCSHMIQNYYYCSFS